MFEESQTVILNRMLGQVSNDVSTSEGSFTYDAISPASNEFAQAYIALDQVVNKFDLSNLSGTELETRIYQRTGLTKNIATYATGVLSVTGTGTINQGALFQTSGGIQFQATESKTITTSGTINIKAVVAGSSGIVPANQITVMPVGISGVVSVTNSSPTQNGYDAESDPVLLQRYYEKIQSPSTQGNIAHFKSLVKDYTGVGDAKVFPTWNGNNTVKIVIIDANKQPPNADFVSKVQAYMDPLGDTWGLGYGAAPFSSFTTIEGATGKSIDISFTAVKNTNFNDAQRQASVETNLTTYLKSIAFIASFVSYAQIGALILQSDGILDYSNLTVNTGTVNIPLADTEIPVKGVVTIV